MYIGQLSEGKEALSSYQRGIECLQKAVTCRKSVAEQAPSASAVATSADIMDTKDEEDDNHENLSPQDLLQETKRQLATAFCTTGELFLTDLCFEEHAEQQCESYVQQALQLTDHSNNNEPTVDALQTVTSLRLSQRRGLEAVDFILRAYDQMKLGCQALSSIVGLREIDQQLQGSGAVELLNLVEVQNLPGFEVRCQIAKLLLECANILKEQLEDVGDGKVSTTVDPKLHQYRQQQDQCASSAVDVLGSLLAENDEVVEIWSLVGDAFDLKCNHATDNGDDCNLRAKLSCQYWERAVEMLESVQESLTAEQQQASDQNEEDEIQQQLDEVVCQLEDIRTKLEKVQTDPEMKEKDALPMEE
jgi:hypothetical protein